MDLRPEFWVYQGEVQMSLESKNSCLEFRCASINHLDAARAEKFNRSLESIILIYQNFRFYRRFLTILNQFFTFAMYLVENVSFYCLAGYES